jgi:hypothetical protein
MDLIYQTVFIVFFGFIVCHTAISWCVVAPPRVSLSMLSPMAAFTEYEPAKYCLFFYHD